VSARSSRGLLLLALAACSAAPRPAPRRGPVVVAIIVDQLASWIADERLPLLPDSGGFARLRREGTWVRELRYAHSITETGPGHAALYSGAVPRDSGVWANEQLDDGGEKRSLFPRPAGRAARARGAAWAVDPETGNRKQEAGNRRSESGSAVSCFLFPASAIS